MLTGITIREIQSIKEIVTPKLLLDALAIDFTEQSLQTQMVKKGIKTIRSFVHMPCK